MGLAERHLAHQHFVARTVATGVRSPFDGRPDLRSNRQTVTAPGQRYSEVMSHHWCRLLLIIGALAIGGVPAQGQQRPILHTNEAYIEEVTRTTTLNVGDPMDVFAFVLDSLPARVKVYPTENYFYFSFFHNGIEYAGNIRIEPHDDGGQAVHFTYYREPSEWHEQTEWNHIVLDAARGVTVDKIDRLAYRIA